MTRAKGVHGGKPLFCGGCRHFEYEDICGYGFCSRDGEERHCFDLCGWQDDAEYGRIPQFRGILREKGGSGLK